MDRDWFTITCEIKCASTEMLRQLEETAARETNLDHTVTRTLEHGPGEVERHTYRLGDYFDSIELRQDEPNGRLQLIFHLREAVDSRWKDLLMSVLRSIGGRFRGTSIEFPRQGP